MSIDSGLLADMRKGRPILWINHDCNSADKELPDSGFLFEDILDAEDILRSYAPVLERFYPELKKSGGIIESPLIPVLDAGRIFKGAAFSNLNLFIKADHLLPVSGSIKARGGIFSVLKHVDVIAAKHGFFTDDRGFVFAEEALDVFSKYTVSVGSTGNLGLSIGIAGRAFGFNVSVHMSSDAKGWKKDMLKSLGADVIEYESDYSEACSQARMSAEQDPFAVFIDDENSSDLFLGYSTAALRLKSQLEETGIEVTEENPLFVYLPCGVGGAPGGITFGLKHLFGDAVHCFFAEPVTAPAMTLGLVSNRYSGISVHEIGLSGKTCADGLAVGRASEFVSRIMARILNGSYTVAEQDFYRYLAILYDAEGLRIEPSAAAGFAGIPMLFESSSGKEYITSRGISQENITHIIWTTGGSMEPEDVFTANYKKGKVLLKQQHLF